MELRENIEIGIGSGHAKKGASAVRRALDSIKGKSKAVHSAGARDAKRHASALGLVKKAALGVTGVLAAKSLIRSQIDFGQAVSDLSAITGAVGQDLDFLRQKSKEFGETTTLSATQAAEAFKVIASAKPDLLENVDALALVTEEAIALAEATGEDLPTAANTLGASLNQFGAAADQSSRFINVLAAGSKRGAALVGEMSEALKFAGVIAAQSGLDFETTNASLQLLSTFAIKGGEAGTQLRGVLLALSSQSQQQFNPEIVGLTTALDNLAKANLSSSKMTLLFGRRNKAAASILIEQRDRLGELTDQITGTNVAYEQQAIRIDNLSGDIKALKSAYEGLELTIGAELNGAFRSLTQSATENIRALSKNPLLQKATRDTLDLIHRIVEDIGLAFDQVTVAVTKAGGGAAVFEGVWGAAIQNIVKWTKFLWEQFVIGGPANLKLGFTLMIGAADLFRIALVEKVRTAVFSVIGLFDAMRLNFVALIRLGTVAVIKTFVGMGHSIESVFDTMKLTIAGVIDSLILQVAEKVTSVARALESLGFDDRAAEVRNISSAITGLATSEEAARKEIEANAAARRAEIAIIDNQIQMIKDKRDKELQASREVSDDLISDTKATADVRRRASLEAINLAIMERDATLEQIKVLRTKRQEIIDGAAAAASADTGGGGLSSPAEEAIDAYKKLGDTQKLIVDGMADGIADMAASGKASFKELAASIIADLIRIQIQSSLTSVFSSILGGISLGGGGVVAPTGGIGTGGATFTPPPSLNAAHGLDFMVGGSGGTDSQRVSFNATPGEEVSVKTPAQQKEAEAGGITLKQTNIIDARGADAARIEAIMPGLFEQNRQRLLSDVIRMRDRGELRK
jgi:TP901 family phage tail tape measure protein/lambda family phage tail tape measure protein